MGGRCGVGGIRCGLTGTGRGVGGMWCAVLSTRCGRMATGAGCGRASVLRSRGGAVVGGAGAGTGAAGELWTGPEHPELEVEIAGAQVANVFPEGRVGRAEVTNPGLIQGALGDYEML